ncbi:MAG: SH3-like domain-containing protein [Haliea sp.]
MSNVFQVGDTVKVLERYPPKDHVRTPHYIRGKTGKVTQLMGEFRNPEELAKGNKDASKKKLYRVRFSQKHAWPDYDGPEHDTLDLDIYEHWLEAAS